MNVETRDGVLTISSERRSMFMEHGATFHAVPDGRGAYMVTMHSQSQGAWAVSPGGLDWRHARAVAKAAAADGHRVRLTQADGYDWTTNAKGERAGLVRS
jgi:hypothetical protein